MAIAVVDREGAEAQREPMGVTGAPSGAPDAPEAHRVPNRVRVALAIAGALVAAYVISLIVRPTGSSFVPLDGWGVAAFELTMGTLCLARYFERTWRQSSAVARLFPLIMGVACISWAIGDFVLTAESLGGGTPPTPSLADLFYVGFFPLCFLGLAFLIRRGNRSSLVMTSLDGMIAGLGIAALSAAFVVAAVIKVTGAGALSTTTSLSYPLGDILLFALCVGGLAVLPRGFRPFFAIAGCRSGGQRHRRRFQPAPAREPHGLHRQRGRVADLVDAARPRGLDSPAQRRAPGDGQGRRLRTAGVRRRHQHRHPLRRQLRAHGQAGAGAGDDHPPGGRGADGRHRP